MVFPFMSKKSDEPARAYIPVNLVQRYASQGIPEQEIVTRLKNQGFASGQIDAALRAVLREKVTGPSRAPPERGPPMSPEQARDQFPTMQMGAKPTGAPAPMQPRRAPEPFEQQQFRQQPMQQPQQMRQPEPVQQQEQSQFTFEGAGSPIESGLGEVTLEEIIEGIVAEKWQDFEERLGNFEERDLQLQQQIQEIRSSVKNVEKIVEKKEQNLVGRFDEFGGSMTEIQGRIGSMEKVFKEFIPELARNVRTLSDMSEKS